ncbi:DNA-binding response regulator, OmpR family, contains REC and winged-helix (wHTH) domain [Flavobacterium sp. CF108]|uniref:response regulator transcription factor n=1 Tax=unclassified Flavobacterium TaxID=196869 RepID=UPI0008AEB269|nr:MULTISPECIES: response regulator transcription factor [unclassified Flavobacterium]SEO18430.1 DNA-binding response regulator, OmpR family, contains REC and winged-helix (wHTH) domain [Flavobacterium sp. fv08]SHG54769.1 DNA-binding response regulator, OmpR family, contains REC and winged-helix (wHTH) domain [Flavobacterium sp. CF108]
MKILVIEDDQRVAELIQRGLEEQGFIVTLAYDGLSGKKLAFNNDYDLIITDIILPKLDGLDLCKEISRIKPELPIIMLTALGTTDDKVEGFDAGADDYLTKPFEMRELLVRIRALLKRSNNTIHNIGFILKYSDLEMNLQTKDVKRNNLDISLTPKEFKLLEYMLQNTERVLSRTEIAEKVWDTNFDTGTNFIDVYINYLRKKIDKNFDKKLIHTKSGMGFILKTDEN